MDPAAGPDCHLSANLHGSKSLATVTQCAALFHALSTSHPAHFDTWLQLQLLQVIGKWLSNGLFMYILPMLKSLAHVAGGIRWFAWL